MLGLHHAREIERATYEGLKTGTHPDRLPDRTVLVSLAERPASISEATATESCPSPPLLPLASPSLPDLLLLALLLLPLRADFPEEDRRFSLLVRATGGCMVSS